jgi:hypothetical protein
MKATTLSAARLFPILLGLLPALCSAALPPSIETLHQSLWKRFIAEPQGLLLDYTLGGDPSLLPSAEEAVAGKPNAISWWTPMENGAFFSGLYLDGIVRRYQMTKSGEDREKAAKLARGLMLCASVGTTPGFVARGVLADGKSHYGIGSDDQTAPWFYGLWRYVRSGIPDDAEKNQIVAKMVEVGVAIQWAGWQMPCDAVGDLKPGQYRGGWSGSDYRGGSRLLFVTRMLFEVTGDPAWGNAYNNFLHEKMPNGQTRLEIVARGIPGEWAEHPALANEHIYIYVVSQAMVADLLAMEIRADVAAKYAESLAAGVRTCAGRTTADVSRLGTAPFRTDWRSMNELWHPQTTTGEAVDLALKQLQFWNNQGRGIEAQSLREPFCAAWITVLGSAKPDPELVEKLAETIRSVPWDKVSSSAGFFGESAWYASQSESRPLP